MTDEKNRVQFMPTQFSLPCDMFACRNAAKYDIGKPVDLSTRIRLCEHCYEELLKSTPKEDLDKLFGAPFIDFKQFPEPIEVTREIALDTLEVFVKQELIGLDELKELVAIMETDGEVEEYTELDGATTISNLKVHEVISDELASAEIVNITEGVISGSVIADLEVLDAHIDSNSIGNAMLGSNDQKISGATINAKELNEVVNEFVDETFTIKMLRDIAKQRGIANYTKYSKDQLIDILNVSNGDSE